MVAGGKRTVTSNSFNMAAMVTDGANTLSLTYDGEHARVKQVTTGGGAGTTYYLNDTITGAMEEKTVAGGTTTWHDYILADGRMVAERFCTGATAPCTRKRLQSAVSVPIAWVTLIAWRTRRKAFGSLIA